MKKSSSCSPRSRGAFTLVEMLVVISIIAILAALVVPAVMSAQKKAKVAKAQLEISQIVEAINHYYSVYSRYPVSSNAMALAVAAGEDFTYGTTAVGSPIVPLMQNPTVPIPPGTKTVNYNANNSEVMAILMDLNAYPNGTLTVNSNHLKNPQQIKFLSPKLSGYDPDTTGVPYPGVDVRGIYRDPWGTPYIISMDLNYDDKCWDTVYRQQLVSQTVPGKQSGYNGLFNSTPTDINGNGDHFAFNGGVMVWSLGADRNYSNSVSAKVSPNADNVLSWK